ncbi:MAG: hypothetical protein JRJ70_17755 [Deltaproteobacteria bacterium]|nr:hypothetical protein [Deltaproteobacteria bacterium]
MGYQKISITVPEEIFKEAKGLAAQRQIKLMMLWLIRSERARRRSSSSVLTKSLKTKK